jgi:hypothetical protein
LWTEQTLLWALTPHVLRAIERYSKDCPLELVTEQPYAGNLKLPLPALPGANLADPNTPIFDPLFSIVRSIEYPIDQQPPEYIDDTDFRLYRTAAGYFILLTQDTPTLQDVMRFTWTARHAPDGSTIPNKDFLAVVDLSAAYAAEQLATIYTQTSDPIFNADVVNYRDKGQQYQSLAKMLRRRYFTHVGVDESNTGADEAKPVMAIGQQFEDLQAGVGRLIHTKYSR